MINRLNHLQPLKPTLMKKIKVFTVMLVLTLGLTNFTYGQSKFYGQWTANCPGEKINSSTVQFCDLCPISKPNISSVEINGFKLSISEENISLDIDNKVTTVPYTWDSSTESMQFTYNNRTFVFKVLSTTDPNLIILKNAEGNLVVLTRK
jgi:hypothetical protein